ncbi:MAG: hypothetical protein ACUVRC_09040 [Desulfotomaculales bacterium]
MSIEWFDPNIGAPSVSIAGYGLTFNRAAIQALGRPKQVMLGFDRVKNAVVVKPLHKPTESELEKSFPFAARERNGSVRIASKEFIRFLTRYYPSIDLKKATRYLAKWDENEEVLIVDLTVHPGGSTERE